MQLIFNNSLRFFLNSNIFQNYHSGLYHSPERHYPLENYFLLLQVWQQIFKGLPLKWCWPKKAFNLLKLWQKANFQKIKQTNIIWNSSLESEDIEQRCEIIFAMEIIRPHSATTKLMWVMKIITNVLVAKNLETIRVVVSLHHLRTADISYLLSIWRISRFAKSIIRDLCVQK